MQPGHFAATHPLWDMSLSVSAALDGAKQTRSLNRTDMLKVGHIYIN